MHTVECYFLDLTWQHVLLPYLSSILSNSQLLKCCCLPTLFPTMQWSFHKWSQQASLRHHNFSWKTSTCVAAMLSAPAPAGCGENRQKHIHSCILALWLLIECCHCRRVASILSVLLLITIYNELCQRQLNTEQASWTEPNGVKWRCQRYFLLSFSSSTTWAASVESKDVGYAARAFPTCGMCCLSTWKWLWVSLRDLFPWGKWQ